MKATCADETGMEFSGEERKPCFMSHVGQVAKEGFREQVMMDELELNARVQFSWVDGEKEGCFSWGNRMDKEMEA